MLQEISRLLDIINTKKAKTTAITLSRVMVAANAMLAVLRRLGLPEEVNDAIRVIQQMMTIMMQFQVIAAASLGPYGWVFAAVGLIGMAGPLLDGLAGY
jgi:hypothetical protein